MTQFPVPYMPFAQFPTAEDLRKLSASAESPVNAGLVQALQEAFAQFNKAMDKLRGPDGMLPRQNRMAVSFGRKGLPLADDVFQAMQRLLACNGLTLSNGGMLLSWGTGDQQAAPKQKPLVCDHCQCTTVWVNYDGRSFCRDSICTEAEGALFPHAAPRHEGRPCGVCAAARAGATDDEGEDQGDEGDDHEEQGGEYEEDEEQSSEEKKEEEEEEEEQSDEEESGALVLVDRTCGWERSGRSGKCGKPAVGVNHMGRPTAWCEEHACVKCGKRRAVRRGDTCYVCLRRELDKDKPTKRARDVTAEEEPVAKRTRKE